jgi:ATP synthase C subunit
VTSGVRFAAANARMRALKGALWGPRDRALLIRSGLEADGRPATARPEDVFPPLVRWYVTFEKMYPAGAPLFTAFFRLHEIENLKLLWRAALSGRAPRLSLWRPLAPLAAIAFPPGSLTLAELVRALDATPYAAIARTLVSAHGEDPAATEIGLDRWAWGRLADEAARLPAAERAARDLVRRYIVEHDVDVLARGAAFGLEPDLVAKATTVLSREERIASLSRTAMWEPRDGPLSHVLPRTLARDGAATNWEELTALLRRGRLRACRRAFSAWPYQLAPAVAALLLREEQARASISAAAARHAGPAGRAMLAHVLAASALED